MKKIKLLALVCLIAFALPAAFATEIDEQEIKSVGEDAVVFINYAGPHKVINTIEEIKEIGSSAAKKMAESDTGRISDGKYTWVRCIDPTVKKGLDAELLILSPTAGVDHIVNLRRIISAYLETAWGYTTVEADTLAVYVTVYNAVYRQDLDYFNKKYKSVVTENLTKDKVGLATNYLEWPGKTQIVIPIANPEDGVDTSVISDTKVTDNLREEENKSVDTRKEMVNIKEKEADKATEKAQETQKQATTAKKEAETAKKEAETAKKKAEENPNDANAQQEAKEKEEVAEKKEEEAKELQEKAEEEQSTADKKRQEAQEERKSIAKDQQDNIDQAAKNANMKTAYGLRLTEAATMLSGLVKINTENGDVVKASPVTVVRNRYVYEQPNGFVCIAGKPDIVASITSNNAAIKLVTIDKDNMEIIVEGNEVVAPRSVLVEKDGYYYCVIDDNGSWVIGKYDKNIKLVAKSTVKVIEETPIMPFDNSVTVTSTDSCLVILNASDLTETAKSGVLGTNGISIPVYDGK